MLLCLYGLVQAVGIPPPGHDAPGELVHDQHLVVLDYIVLVAEHQVVGPQGQYDIVLDLQVLGIRVVLDMEEILHFLHAGRGEVHHLVLLVDDEVPALLLDHAHDGVHLGQLLHVRAPLHPAGQQVAHLIEGGGFAALAGDDQRRPGLVDQHRVHLVYDAEVQAPQDKLLLVDDHIVAQVIEAQLVVGHIGDVALVGLLALLAGHAVEDHSHGQAQELMHLSHPLRVTLHQIVVHRHHMDALALQGIEVGREQECLGLSFTGAQFRDAALVHDDAADQLYSVMLCLQHPGRGLPDGGVGLGKQIVQSRSLRQPLLEFRSLVPQLLIGEGLHLGTQPFDFLHQGHDPLDLPLAVSAKYLIDYLHGYSYLSMALYKSPALYCTRFVRRIQHLAVGRYEYFINIL